MRKLLDEYRMFSSQPRPMRMLLLTNIVYAFALPIIELFIGAYIIRTSNDVSLVMVYQLAQVPAYRLPSSLTVICSDASQSRVCMPWV
jgi:hypothetical protein